MQEVSLLQKIVTSCISGAGVHPLKREEKVCSPCMPCVIMHAVCDHACSANIKHSACVSLHVDKSIGFHAAKPSISRLKHIFKISQRSMLLR